MAGLLDDLVPALATRLRPHLRTAFVPVVEPGDPDEPVAKLAGRPWLPDGKDWPVCPSCKKPMQLFLQLDLRALPPGAPDFGFGLAQIFSCASTTPACAADGKAFARTVETRVVSLAGEGATAPTMLATRSEADLANGRFAPQRITGWKATEDLPADRELATLLELSAEERAAIKKLARPIAGEKLAGWPKWIQDTAYPKCPRCSAPMRLLFQIDSGDKLGAQFGTAGCAHLTQCATHKNVLAFAW